jgi:NADH dehydrogenase/NADH:ubiquinone oxidoreductase subunit G
MINLQINGTNLDVPEGTTVLNAAKLAGITIPTLCDHPDLKPYGGCRLCLVEVKGSRLPMTSCTLPATPGMEVTTESPALTDSRRTVLELLLSNYYDKNGANGALHKESEFMHWVREYSVDYERVKAKAPRFPKSTAIPNPFVRVDMNKCILCTRCVRACAEVQGRFVWSQAERGFNTHIVAGAGTDMLDARCESCGACVAYCPTGALDNKMAPSEAGKPDRLVTTTCTYCGVGCQLRPEYRKRSDHPSHIKPRMHRSTACICASKAATDTTLSIILNGWAKPRVRKYLLDGTPSP